MEIRYVEDMKTLPFESQKKALEALRALDGMDAWSLGVFVTALLNIEPVAIASFTQLKACHCDDCKAAEDKLSATKVRMTELTPEQMAGLSSGPTGDQPS
jgi:hypothetical protein